jgi:hypothetical protein
MTTSLTVFFLTEHTDFLGTFPVICQKDATIITSKEKKKKKRNGSLQLFVKHRLQF